MTVNLEELERLARAATPGPWVRESLEPRTYGLDWVDGPDRRKLAVCGDVIGNGTHGYCEIVGCDEIAANAAYIAAANPAAVLAVIAAHKEALAQLETARSVADDAIRMIEALVLQEFNAWPNKPGASTRYNQDMGYPERLRKRLEDTPIVEPRA